jgi:hypothetical protein
MRAIFILFAGLAAVACTGPREVASSRPSVTYRVAQGEGVQADQRATAFCAAYNLRPAVVRTVPDGTAIVATYECR